MSSVEPRQQAEAEVVDLDFEALLEYIHRSRGFNSTGYKRPSLTRRVDKRMQAVGVVDYAPYVD